MADEVVMHGIYDGVPYTVESESQYSPDLGYTWFKVGHEPTPIELAKMKAAAYFRALNRDERLWK